MSGDGLDREDDRGDPRCNVHNCGEDAEFWWDNRISGLTGYKCLDHARGLARTGYTLEDMWADRTLRPIKEGPA